MFSKEIYSRRRTSLIRKVGNGVILLLGNSEAPCNYQSNTYKFRQDSSFLYFTGLASPDLALVMDAESGEQILFGNNADIDDIIWMGPQPTINDFAQSCGIEKALPFADLEIYVKAILSQGRRLHFLPPYRNHNKILLNALTSIPIPALKENSSLELVKAVVDLRLVKEECEIAEIEKACEIGYAMHYTVMKMAKPGVTEQTLYGIMEGIAHSQGAMTSFPTILSQNGETLHNHSHHQVLTEGRMMVIDAGAENEMNYCSDFTRTLPSGGRFTEQQKDIYRIVSTANNMGQSLSRPSVLRAPDGQAIPLTLKFRLAHTHGQRLGADIFRHSGPPLKFLSRPDLALISPKGISHKSRPRNMRDGPRSVPPRLIKILKLLGLV